MKQPIFPLTIKSIDTENEIVSSEQELVMALEWFDSTDGDETVQVFDATGAPVTVVIEALEIKRLEVDSD